MPRALQVWRPATVPSNMLEHVENLKEAALDKSRPGARSLVPEQGEEAYARGLSEAERFRRLAPPLNVGYFSALPVPTSFITR